MLLVSKFRDGAMDQKMVTINFVTKLASIVFLDPNVVPVRGEDKGLTSCYKLQENVCITLVERVSSSPETIEEALIGWGH